MVFERYEACPEATLGVEVGEEEVEADNEDEACYYGPLDDVAGL